MFSGIQYHLRHLSCRLPAGVFIFYCCHNKLSSHFCISVSGYSMAHSGPLFSLPRLKLKCQQVCVPCSGLGQVQFLAVWALRSLFSCWLSSSKGPVFAPRTRLHFFSCFPMASSSNNGLRLSHALNLSNIFSIFVFPAWCQSFLG